MKSTSNYTRIYKLVCNYKSIHFCISGSVEKNAISTEKKNQFAKHLARNMLVSVSLTLKQNKIVLHERREKNAWLLTWLPIEPLNDNVYEISFRFNANSRTLTISCERTRYATRHCVTKCSDCLSLFLSICVCVFSTYAWWCQWNANNNLLLRLWTNYYICVVSIRR